MKVRAAQDAKKNPAGSADAGNKVDTAETAFGERGLVERADGAPAFSRYLVGNTPHGAWYDGLQK